MKVKFVNSNYPYTQRLVMDTVYEIQDINYESEHYLIDGHWYPMHCFDETVKTVKELTIMNNIYRLEEQVKVNYRQDEHDGIIKGYGNLLNDYGDLKTCWLIYLPSYNSTVIISDISLITKNTNH